MRNLHQIISSVARVAFCASMILFFGTNLTAQNKKERVRLNAEYVKVTSEENFLNIKASARINKQTVAVKNIKLTVFEVILEEETEIGKLMTNNMGIAKFVIKDFSALKSDSTGVYNLSVVFDGNESFKKASRDVTFRDATIVTDLVQKDSLNFITAKLIDTALDSVLEGVDLNVRVERLFRGLKLGEDFYTTDNDGQIQVQIEDGIPAVNGILTIEVVLNESDDYGTVISTLDAPVGKVIVDESTFDQRTMWSPRGKTPFVLLAITYSFIFIVWGIFLYLFINLIRIMKS